ncbi:MAG: hypothetical protein ACI8PQ_003505, partial [Planctomycetota bacterium]
MLLAQWDALGSVGKNSTDPGFADPKWGLSLLTTG